MDCYLLGLQQYCVVKLWIYENVKICVVNVDDVFIMLVCGVDECCISFGVDVGDYYFNCQQGEIWLCVKGEKVFNVKEMFFIGQYNYSNVLVVLVLVDVVGLLWVSSLKVLIIFIGLVYCFQLVLDYNGVCWINDLKVINVGSIEVVLNGLQLDGMFYLLLGGDGKFVDFILLKCYFGGDCICLYCFGCDGVEFVELCFEVVV